MKKIYKIILMLVAVICMVLSPLTPTITARAETTKEYTILDDLKDISDFDSTTYTNNTADYSVELVQVLEKDNMLYAYVYRGSQLADSVNLVSINMAVADSKEITDYSFNNYKIEVVTSENGFYKCKVIGLNIPTTEYREYNISSIFTNEESENSDGTKTTEKAYEVAKRFCFNTQDGKTTCVKIATEIVEITDKYCGFVRYKNNDAPSWIGKSSCDSHFVAFSTDKNIDKLLQADVFFTSQSYTYYNSLKPDLSGGLKETFGDKKSETKQLDYTNKISISNDKKLWFNAYNYEFNEIQTIEDFNNSVNYDLVYKGSIFNTRTESKITDEEKENLNNKQFVLRYFETDYFYSKTLSVEEERKTICGDITILRLKFETDGVTYNLGVVDDKTNENDKPANETTTTIEPSDWLKNLWSVIKVLLIIIPILIVTAILAPILPAIFSVLVKVINFIINLVIMPFKAIKRKKDKNK